MLKYLRQQFPGKLSLHNLDNLYNVLIFLSNQYAKGPLHYLSAHSVHLCYYYFLLSSEEFLYIYLIALSYWYYRISICKEDQSSSINQVSPLQSMCSISKSWFPWAGNANSQLENREYSLTTKLFLNISNSVAIFLRCFRSNYQFGSPIFFPKPIFSQHMILVAVTNICSRLNYLLKIPSFRQTIKVDSIFWFVNISCPLISSFFRMSSLSNINLPITIVPNSLIIKFSVSAINVVLPYSIFKDTFSPSAIYRFGYSEIFLIQATGMLKFAFRVLLTDCYFAVLMTVGSLMDSNLYTHFPRYCDFFHIMYSFGPQSIGFINNTLQLKIPSTMQELNGGFLQKIKSVKDQIYLSTSKRVPLYLSYNTVVSIQSHKRSRQTVSPLTAAADVATGPPEPNQHFQCHHNNLGRMSTYHPKTLKRWKVHKRSLLDLRDRLPAEPHPLERSQVIHSLELDRNDAPAPYPFRKERYRLEEGRSKSLHFSNGFRKVRKEHAGLAFSKVVSEEHFIRVDFAADDKNNQRTTVNPSLPRMIPKRKKLVLIRSQARKVGTNSTLKDLLQVKQSSQADPGEVLQTDGEQGSLHLLENEAFSPYRVRKHQKHNETCPPQQQRPLPLHHAKPVPAAERGGQQKKREDLTSDAIFNFMCISEIDLKAKQGMRLVVSKKRSFSVMDLLQCRREGQQATRYSRIVHAEIEPWQTDK